jgi:hypothetical protein
MAINIKEISFDINHLSIDTSSIQIYDLANKDFEDSANQFNNELNNHQIYDSQSLLNAPELFTLYFPYMRLESFTVTRYSKTIEKKSFLSNCKKS